MYCHIYDHLIFEECQNSNGECTVFLTNGTDVNWKSPEKRMKLETDLNLYVNFQNGWKTQKEEAKE